MKRPARIQASRPDVVLVGPGNARAVLEALPREAGVTLLPVLVLCATQDPDARVEFLRAGALLCFAGPQDPVELEAHIGAAVARLAACLRGGDTLVRWGGEEFVALLPDTAPDGLLLTAERLRRSVGGEPFASAPRASS